MHCSFPEGIDFLIEAVFILIQAARTDLLRKIWKVAPATMKAQINKNVRMDLGVTLEQMISDIEQQEHVHTKISEETEDEELDQEDFAADFFTEAGFAKKEIMGKTLQLFIGENNDRNEWVKLARAVYNKEACEIEIINYKKNKQPFSNNISIFPVANLSGFITHWIAIAKDITNKKNKEAKLI